MAEVRQDLPTECLKESCQDEDCVLEVSQLPSDRCLTRVDGCDELASQDLKRCDFLLFVQSSSSKGHWVVPIELKGGHVKKDDLEGIRDQLQTGAGVAETQLANVGSDNEQVRLRPILGFGKTLQSWVQRNLTKPEYRITMRGRTEQIRPLKCGGKIREKLR